MPLRWPRLPELRHRARTFIRPTAFTIDIINACNLRCPTCPIANWPAKMWTGVTGVMEKDVLDAILRKALAEGFVGDISLYAYSEPLLHPGLPDLIRVVKSLGLSCDISTNLNRLPDPDALLSAGPDILVISVSGFHQEHYGVTHAGGDIDVVKRNMIALSESARRIRPHTQIAVSFHKYRTNLSDLPLMEEFARSLGFEFDAYWASIFPAEKAWSYAYPDSPQTDLTDADRRIIDRVAIPLREVLDAASREPTQSCTLQDHHMVLDVKGNVYVCCATAMDSQRNRIASFLETPSHELQAQKKAHPTCRQCMAHGLPEILASSYGSPAVVALTERRLWESRPGSRQT